MPVAGITIVSTPCRKICRILHGKCVGCGRTQDQIRLWSTFSETKRKKIMRELDLRRGADPAKDEAENG